MRPLIADCLKNNFFKRAKEIHGDKYNYSKVLFISSYNPVEIICKKHGSFFQKPIIHVNKKIIHGCPKCGTESAALKVRKGIKKFIEEAKKIHPEYDYYRIRSYKNNKTKLEVVCKKHGSFFISPNSLISHKSGCKKCRDEKAHFNKLGSLEEFIEDSKRIHGNFYDYSLTSYYNSKNKVKIICPLHGIFEVSPHNHISRKSGCPKCADQNNGIRKRLSQEDVIKKFIEKHKNKYDYSKVKYKTSLNKVIIICKKHGEFKQIVHQHINGVECPICRSSKGEKAIHEWLELNNIIYVHNKKFSACKNKHLLPFDFYLPDKNICIEYDGELHYKTFRKTESGTEKLEKTQKNDLIKNAFCIGTGIKLIRVPYWKFKNISKILNSELNV